MEGYTVKQVSTARGRFGQDVSESQGRRFRFWESQTRLVRASTVSIWGSCVIGVRFLVNTFEHYSLETYQRHSLN
jgi:hypothetical protein